MPTGFPEPVKAWSLPDHLYLVSGWPAGYQDASPISWADNIIGPYDDSAETCALVAQSATTPGIWNPLPFFGDVRADHQLNNVQIPEDYFAATKMGTLPSVSWIHA